MSRAANPQISFADLELLQQGLVLEPLLQAISDFLADHEAMIETIRRDLRRGLKRPDTGRNGLTAQQVLRSLVLMRVKNWDYRELRERIADGYTLRRFTDFYCQPVPKHDAFHRSFIRLTPETLAAVNELVVQAAVAGAGSDQARQGANAAGVRPQSLSRRERAWSDHAISSAERKSFRRGKVGERKRSRHALRHSPCRKEV